MPQKVPITQESYLSLSSLLAAALAALAALAAALACCWRCRCASKMLHRTRLLISHLLLEIGERHLADLVPLGVAKNIAVVLHALGRTLVGRIANHDEAGVGRDLALLVALFVQIAIDRAAILVDHAANDTELVAAVAVEVHDPGQGEMVLLARRPERGEDLVAGHDGIGELVVNDAGLGLVIAVIRVTSIVPFLTALAPLVDSAE